MAATKTRPKESANQRAARHIRARKAKMILKSDTVNITGKKTILYSEVIKQEILKSTELTKAIIQQVEEANIVGEIFEKAGYIPVVETRPTGGQRGPKRNFKSEEDKEKAREHIAARYEAAGGIKTTAKGRKVQDRKVVKGVPQVQWSVEAVEGKGRSTVVIKTDDEGVSFQEVNLRKIGPKMRRRSKRNKTPEDGL